MLFRSRQIRSQESFKEPLVYNICDEGIVIRQNDQRADIVWSEVRKVIETKKAVFIYTSPVRAFIFPKDQVDDFSSFRKMIREKTGK